MNKLTRMLLILFITIAGSGTTSGLDRLDRFMRRENRKLERIEKRKLKHEIRDKREVVVNMASYEVIISENVGKTILIEANSADEAWELIDGGNWDESMVVKKKLIDRMTCSVEEAGSFERFAQELKNE